MFLAVGRGESLYFRYVYTGKPLFLYMFIAKASIFGAGVTQPPKTGVMWPLRLRNVLGHLASKFSGHLATGYFSLLPSKDAARI